jgi:exonuclease III
LGVDEVSQTAKLASYVQQLVKQRIRACGLAESRLPGNGQRQLAGGWHLLWSGASPSKPRQHGVGLLLDPTWHNCLIDWSAVSERILVARFRARNEINVALVVAYSPTDVAERAAKDAFYMQLHSTVSGFQPSRDMVVLMGDFNGQVGTNPTPYGGVMGSHGYGQQEPSENGERLLQLAQSINQNAKPAMLLPPASM